MAALLAGAGLILQPAFDAHQAVGWFRDAHITHALLIINGRCAQQSADLAPLKYHLIRAIGRALAALGYGTQFAPELNEEHRIVDAPVDRGTPTSESTNNSGARRPIAAVRPGSIVSLHFGHSGTIDALPAILDALHTRGLRPVTVSDLLA